MSDPGIVSIFQQPSLFDLLALRELTQTADDRSKSQIYQINRIAQLRWLENTYLFVITNIILIHWQGTDDTLRQY